MREELRTMQPKARIGILGICLALGWTSLTGAAQPVAADQVRQLDIVQTLAKPKDGKAEGEATLSSYLLVYFKDETHSLHFAVSTDGYHFTDVNNGQPVLNGRDIAEQKGIRDPHIVRGPDNAFYLAMTDLHIFAKREGLRDTEWERPDETYGWGNNHAMIFMKSYDLIHWSHAIVPVDRLFKSTANIGAAWAPETIYDPQKRKMMVYFTTRNGKETDHMVYSYADDAFTTLVTEPKNLFTYPKVRISTIDGDITKIGDTYHLFYVAHDRPGYLRQATSARINGGYVFNPAKIDPETVGTEAPNLWRRHGTNTYVLMYDVFGAKPVNTMGFSETEDFVHFRNLGHFNDPGSPMKATNFVQPKHGAVIPISNEELDRLRQYFTPKG
ncbi:glycoside hydrolase family 43 protein [Sphingobium sp. BYY-5]|uniref:glycoside hydrolase family 43 protein n=1 Tax=Sphingobium sp. BYY-5 TaxID=2926400 RepID=UPI001FA784D4|nr:glycoside hydrolase family 43 protein [Sphingobium sp. BYY-5]MCI4591716.1 glycoside hydrolase family 43 protein [Sphingobium sp. BYY-5]